MPFHSPRTAQLGIALHCVAWLRVVVKRERRRRARDSPVLSHPAGLLSGRLSSSDAPGVASVVGARKHSAKRVVAAPSFRRRHILQRSATASADGPDSAAWAHIAHALARTVPPSRTYRTLAIDAVSHITHSSHTKHHLSQAHNRHSRPLTPAHAHPRPFTRPPALAVPRALCPTVKYPIRASSRPASASTVRCGRPSPGVS